MNAALYMIQVNKLVLSKENDSVRDTLKKMKEGSFKTLPVVDEANYFIGVVKDVNLNLRWISEHSEEQIRR